MTCFDNIPSISKHTPNRWEDRPKKAFKLNPSIYAPERAHCPRNLNSKIKIAQKMSTSSSLAAPTSPLYQKIWKGFLAKNGDCFTNYPKEGKGVRGLIEKARARFGDDCEAGLISVCAQFWKLKQTGNAFWKDQPFLPSALNSSGIWDRVLETLRRKEIDPEVAALIGAPA